MSSPRHHEPLVLALVIVSALSSALPALAQRRASSASDAAPSDASGAEARQRFVSGVELYDEGNYAAALAEFRRSYELQPVAGVLINVAVTLEELYRYDEALDAYRLYLSTADRASAERRQAVQTSMDELERRIATLTMTVDRAGAEVLIDGRSVGHTPLDAPLRVASGARVIEVHLEGFVSVREEVELAGGVTREIAIRLAPVDRNGVLRVATEPAEATVRIDGLEVGRGPVERRVSMGGHVVEAFLDTYQTYRTEISVADRQELDLRLVLDRVAHAITDEAWFWVIVGVGIVGAAGAITAGLVCTQTDACTNIVVVEGNISPGVLRL